MNKRMCLVTALTAAVAASPAFAAADGQSQARDGGQQAQDLTVEPERPDPSRPAHIPPDANLRSDEPSQVVGTGDEERPYAAAGIAEEDLQGLDTELLDRLSRNAVAGMQVSNLATGKHIPEEIRILSEEMAATQTEIANRVQAIGRAADIAVDDTISDEGFQAIEQMRDLNEMEFSRNYAAFMQDNYQNTIDLLSQATQGETAPVIADLADDVLPQMQAHNDTLSQLQFAEVPDEEGATGGMDDSQFR